MNAAHSDALVFFGATGDLAYKMKCAKGVHTVVQPFCTPAPVRACLDGKSEYSERGQGAGS